MTKQKVKILAGFLAEFLVGLALNQGDVTSLLSAIGTALGALDSVKT
jgi:hypothetical protein